MRAFLLCLREQPGKKDLKLREKSGNQQSEKDLGLDSSTDISLKGTGHSRLHEGRRDEDAGELQSCREGEMMVFITHGFQCLGEMGEEHLLRMGEVVGSPVDLMDSGGDT